MNAPISRLQFMAAGSALGALAACGGAATALAPTVAGPAGTLYVADSTPAVFTFPLPLLQGGNEAPARRIAGPLNTLTSPASIAHDAAGTIYVSETTSATIKVFAAGAQGNVAPVRTLGGSNTLIPAAAPLAVDAAGNLIVAVAGTAGGASGSILRFANGASGNVAPASIVTGPATTLLRPAAIALGPDGSIFVAEFAGGIKVFAPDAAGNAAPARTLGVSAAPNPVGPVAVGGDGTVYARSAQPVVSGFASGVLTYPPGALEGTKPGAQPVGVIPAVMAVDDGNLYVLAASGPGVYVFAKSSLLAPVALLSGSSTTLSVPVAIAR